MDGRMPHASARRHHLSPRLESPTAAHGGETRLGSPFQLRKLFHRSSDPSLSDVDMCDAVDMGEHAAWGNLDEPIYAEKDFEIYRPAPQRSALPVYYIKGWLPYSADTLFNVLTDFRYRKDWDKRLQDARLLEMTRQHDVVYVSVALPWPYATRDYVFQRRTKYFPHQNAFVMISQSAHHPAAPDCAGVVRVETYASRMSIRSTGTSSCDFYVEYEDDTNFSIPNYIVNWLLSIHVPAFMTDLRKACANYGGFAKTLDEAGVQLIPSHAARKRAAAGMAPSSLSSGGLAGGSNLENSEALSESTKCTTKAHVKSRSRRDRRPINFHGEEHSECEPSSSSERDQRGRNLLGLGATDSDRKRESNAAKGMKKKSSMSKLFSGKNARTRSLSSSRCSEEFTVQFCKSCIGLHLEADVGTNRVFVAVCERNSEAADCKPPIVPGMQVVSVNGESIVDIPSDDALERIKQSGRPMSLGFCQPNVSSKALKKLRTSKSSMQCIAIRDENDLVNYLRPLDGDGNVGAVLKTRYQALRFSKRVMHAVRSNKSSGSSHRQHEVVDIPKGCVLQLVDDCCVSSLPFAEIIHLLARNGEPKVVTFKETFAITGNDQNNDPSRAALSKKLSGMFKWRTGSEDGMFASSNSNASLKRCLKEDDPNTGSSATADTDTSSTIESPSISRKAAPALVCLPDYSRVAISTKNITWAWDHVHLLKADERIFSAAMLIEKIESFLMKDNNVADAVAVNAVLTKMHDEREWVNQIKVRRNLGVCALHEFNSEEDADWIFGQAYFGVSTHWKPGDDGTVWLKLDGLVEGVDIFNTVAVMNEIDLFSCWVPFCNQSVLLHRSGYVDILCYVSMAVPLLKRDAIIRAVGINACYESRCILLLGGSVDESQVPSSVTIPKAKGWNTERLEMKAFRALIEPISRTKARTCIVCNIDPKCPIPRSLLNFSIKKVAGILLFLLRKEAEKIEKAQQDGTPSDHVKRLDLDPYKFYAWLRPQMDRWFSDLQTDRLPPRLALPLPSDLDRLHDLNRAASSSSLNSPTSMSRQSSQASLLFDNSPTKCDEGLKPSSGYTKSTGATEGRGHISQPVGLAGRTWSDYLYEFGIWPYFLLVIFAGVTPEHSFLSVCVLKFVFTCTCTWFGVPGAYSRQTRQLKRARLELDTLRRRFVLLAAVYDVMSSWLLRVWVNWLVCYATLFPTQTTACFRRGPLEIREAENAWLLGSAFTFATVVVVIQVLVNI